jgi:hypothetical protein
MSLDEELNRIIELESQDHVIFKINEKSARNVGLIKSALFDKNATTLSLKISADILSKIVEFMNHYAGNEPPLPKFPMTHKCMCHPENGNMDHWGIDFVTNIVTNENMGKLYDLIDASNYLDYHTLLLYSCARFVSCIRGEISDSQWTRFSTKYSPDHKYVLDPYLEVEKCHSIHSSDN